MPKVYENQGGSLVLVRDLLAPAGALESQLATLMAGVTKTASFTLDGADDVGGLAKAVCSHVATAITATIPPDATYSWQEGTQILVERGGAAAVTIARGSDVALHEEIDLADGGWSQDAAQDWRVALSVEPTHEPTHVNIDGAPAASGTYNALSAGQWDWISGRLFVDDGAGAPNTVTWWKERSIADTAWPATYGLLYDLPLATEPTKVKWGGAVKTRDNSPDSNNDWNWVGGVLTIYNNVGFPTGVSWWVENSITDGTWALSAGAEYSVALVTEPTDVSDGGGALVRGTAGALAAGEWDWAADTLYVRAANDLSPTGVKWWVETPIADSAWVDEVGPEYNSGVWLPSTSFPTHVSVGGTLYTKIASGALAAQQWKMERNKIIVHAPSGYPTDVKYWREVAVADADWAMQFNRALTPKPHAVLVGGSVLMENTAAGQLLPGEWHWADNVLSVCVGAAEPASVAYRKTSLNYGLPAQGAQAWIKKIGFNTWTVEAVS